MLGNDVSWIGIDLLVRIWIEVVLFLGGLTWMESWKWWWGGGKWIVYFH